MLEGVSHLPDLSVLPVGLLMTSAEQTEAIRQSMQDEKATKDEVIRELVAAVEEAEWMAEGIMMDFSDPDQDCPDDGLCGEMACADCGCIKDKRTRFQAALRKAGAL